jgi:hypothetical protein
MSAVRRALYVVMIAALAAAAGGCVAPRARLAHLARAARFQEDLVTGATFRHRIYRREALDPDASGVLHVYIEGDGQPFLSPTTVALDPTPREPLMLRLMALDPARSLYLGRPCYFDLSHDPGCDPSFWTVRRFSPEVVNSLAVVLRSEVVRAHAREVELYGHSGGGTLAVLLAARVASVTRVVTIGATLDTTAWCALHGYTPLLGSMNPTELGPHPGLPRMLHLVGSQDTNTPPELVQSAAAKIGASGSVRIVRGYTHNCCWQEIWGDVLHGDPYGAAR